MREMNPDVADPKNNDGNDPAETDVGSIPVTEKKTIFEKTVMPNINIIIARKDGFFYRYPKKSGSKESMSACFAACCPC